MQPTDAGVKHQHGGTWFRRCSCQTRCIPVLQFGSHRLSRNLCRTTGTGKDLFAYACHQASPRAGKPYLALNCASIPEDAVESELFGHAPEGKKGFFEQANGGSVLLDEIGEMSPRMQAKLLRFLNDGTFRRVGEDDEVHVDVRVICATQKNLVELDNLAIQQLNCRFFLAVGDIVAGIKHIGRF